MPKTGKKRSSTGDVHLGAPAKKTGGVNRSPQDDVENPNQLAKNKFSGLPQDDTGASTAPEMKEKLPPFYVTAGSDFRQQIVARIKEGQLHATIRLTTNGYKVMTSTGSSHKSIREFLVNRKVEFYTHDIATIKPFKVVLRGLHSMEAEQLESVLKTRQLKVQAVFIMRRHNKERKYRDELYLIHLERGSTTLSELANGHELIDEFSTKVSWERYKPKHRDVTQCTKCLNFGHGAKNCFMKQRCKTCGEDHDDTAQCSTMDENATTKCVNCNGNHSSTSRSCPKRAEFINIRKNAAARRQPNRKNSLPVPDLSPSNFPSLSQHSALRARLIPNLEPLPLTQQPAAWSSTPPRNPPGFRQSESSPQPSSASNNSNDLYDATELLSIFHEMTAKLSACKSKMDQISTLGEFIIRFGTNNGK